MIGLKRGTVKLCEHEKEWEFEAQNTISRLKQILGNVIKDIQHVGSTSILSIKAKPIIDIAVAVDVFRRDTRTTSTPCIELFKPFFGAFARKYLDFKLRCIIIC